MTDNKIVREKLENLLDSIHAQYGSDLTNELISRLENTINDFNEEVESLLNELKENASLKEKLMDDIKAGKEVEEQSDSNDSGTEKTEEAKEMSEWEKRVEALS